VRQVTGKAIKLVGTGEKVSDLEVFHPDRAASRILGMGDILTLIEKAQADVDADEAAAMEKKLRKAQFTLDDFRTQMRRIKKLGSIEGLLKMIPGMSQVRKQLGEVQMPEKEMARVEAIINSMTKAERATPKIINVSRKERIARGSGTTVLEVGQLLKNFTQMQKMMQRMMGGKGMPSMPKMPPGMKMPGGMPGGMPQMPPGMGGMDGMPPGGGMPLDPEAVKAARAAAKAAAKKKKDQRKKRKKR
jgi:signal recognition particle subunit SRP54